MAKLADVTAETRTLLKILAGAFVVVAAIFLFLKGGIIFKNLFFPTPPAPPEEKFGKLPSPAFPNQTPPNYDYQIDTIDGNLPELGSRINVYKVITVQPSLVALDNAKSLLTSGGFNQGQTKITNSVYQWSNGNGQSIQYDIFTNNFKITSSIAPPPPGIDFTKDSLFQNITNFLGNVGEDTSDINEDNSSITYLKLDGGNFVPADSQNTAQAAQLTLAQNNIQDKIGKFLIYYPATPPMYFIYEEAGGLPTIIAGSFYHYVADTKDFTDYPIKTAQQAFEDLKNGHAYVVTGASAGSTISITSVVLGYYSGENSSDYFLPVVVFSGKGFNAYVPAIPESLIEQ